MNKFKNFALMHPFLFGIVLILLYSMIATLAYPVHFMFPDNEGGQLYGDALAKLIVFLVFLIVLQRFGWTSISGITRAGKLKIWPVVAVLLLYRVLSELYAFTGGISITIADLPLASAHLALAFSTALLEETMVRGLVLIAMLLAWGSTKRGQLKAILFSSLLFGLLHLVNLLVRPFEVVLMQALILTLPGIFYAALVLSYRNLWPAILIHWLGNAAVNIKLIEYENFQETFSMWILNGAFLLLLTAFSFYLIRGLPQSKEILSTDSGRTLISQKDAIPSS